MSTSTVVDDTNSHISEQLRSLAVDVGTLSLDPTNARTHSDRNLDAIANSLKRFGQRKPIVVQKTGMVVRAGNGTLEAARKLGWPTVAAVIVDEDNFDAVSFAIADNRTGDLSDWDYNTLSDLIREIEAHDSESLKNLGWTQDELDTFVADNSFDLGVDGSDTNDEFADAPQFTTELRAIFLIEATADKAEDSEFKAAIESLCSEFEVTYKVRLA